MICGGRGKGRFLFPFYFLLPVGEKLDEGEFFV